MFILQPYIFKKFPEIIFGFSTKVNANSIAPYFFNLSFSVGDNNETVEKNRALFFNKIGLSNNTISFQRQIHSDIIKTVDCSGDCGESDALITSRRNLGLAVVIADCTPVFIYDIKNKVVAAVHAGWRGTLENILNKTLSKLSNDFHSEPENLFVYIGPSISQNNYEVGIEVAEKFSAEYVLNKNNKFFLDVSGINYDSLVNFGVPKNQIQKSVLCTYEFNELFHSFRRDGNLSGRSLGVIAIKA